ncbi:MAG TPA: DUF3597 domain-containing protein [Longilinea sp.]|nr:DUF3597 domain-containing protein [Longilinea sp.]
MAIFDTILEKLGLNKQASGSSQNVMPPQEKAGFSSTPKGPASITSPSMAPGSMPAHEIPAQGAAPMAMVDVAAKLDAMARKDPRPLEWKVSIADLLALLGMDYSLQARIELAKELGCPENLMGGDHANMNIWLHKTVLQKIAQNGGNVPQSLLK